MKEDVVETVQQPLPVDKAKENQADTALPEKHAPKITHIKLLPEVFKAGDTLQVEASAKDSKGNDASLLYEWTKNGEPAGRGRSIETPIRRGDKISIKVMPFDGRIYGTSVILTREIANLPPMIIEDKNFNFDGKIYSYQVRASDPDGDALTYSLKTAPQGMTIDSATGLIQWNVPSDFKGKVQATVSVTDGHNGEALYPIKITIGQ